MLPQGCGGGEGGGVKQGTVNVEGLKVGVPESIIKDAVLTFVLDESPAAKAGGRNQYLSRTKDSKGGQFSAQCKDGNCFRLEAIYVEPITKEQALETLGKMLPASAGTPTLRAGNEKNAEAGIEKYDCGETFVGEFTLVEPKSDKVRLVAAIDKSKMKKEGGDDAPAATEEKKEGAADDAAKTEETKTETTTETKTEETKSE
jgi:hypothetical protein